MLVLFIVLYTLYTVVVLLCLHSITDRGDFIDQPYWH